MAEERAAEIAEKLARARRLLAERNRRGLLLATPAGFAWLTGGGRNHVGVATERGVAALLVTPDDAWLLADNIERARLEAEELPGHPFAVREFAWWESDLFREAAALVSPEELLSDLPLPGAALLSPAEGMRLRNPLLPAEAARYRALGEAVAVALTHAVLHLRPGLSERQAAGLLGGTLLDFGIEPVVLLVAGDERARERRHPLPTERRIERYALLAVGARRQGLHVSATRLVHFGPAPEALRRRLEACARVDAALLAATRPGAPFAEIFRAAQRAYAAEGFPEEWRCHHQGGPTGYQGRDLRIGPATDGAAQLGQAFAWNPTIAGVKSEDTVLLGPHGLECLSRTPDLPELEVEAGGQRFLRAGIMER